MGSQFWQDADGDGRDDDTNLTQEMYNTPGGIARRAKIGPSPWEDANMTQEEWRALPPEQRSQAIDYQLSLRSARLRGDAVGTSQDPFEAVYQPGVDEMSVEYVAPEYADDPSAYTEERAAQMDALGQLQDVYRERGLTSADRSRMQLGAMEVGQAMRGQREADMAALQARGMGGSGAQVASALSAQQAGAMGMSSRDAQMQISAQQRALEAMQGAAGVAGQARSQIDQFNQQNRQNRQDWYANVASAANNSAESRAGAYQQRFNNQMGKAAAKQGHVEFNVGQQNHEQDREDNWIKTGIGAAGSFVGGVSS